MWSDRTKIALEEKVFRNSQSRFCSLYVKLATVQI